MSETLSDAFGILQRIPQNKNALLRTHYLFYISRLPNTSYFCNKVILPESGISIVNQPTLFNTIKRPGGEIKHSPIHLEFLIDEDFANWKEIFTWIKNCSDYINFDDYTPPSEHLSQSAGLLILDSNNTIKHKFTFTNIFPVFLGGLGFDSKIKDSQPFTCKAEFAFTSYEVHSI